MSERGPVYGVELIDSLPLGDVGMEQAMPSRDDLERVRKVSERTVAGYEVLLASYREIKESLDLPLVTALRKIATAEIDKPAVHTDESYILMEQCIELRTIAREALGMDE